MPVSSRSSSPSISSRTTSYSSGYKSSSYSSSYKSNSKKKKYYDEPIHSWYHRPLLSSSSNDKSPNYSSECYKYEKCLKKHDKEYCRNKYDKYYQCS